MFLLILLLTILLLLLFLSIKSFIKWKFAYWKVRGVPTISPTFPFGNIKGASTTRHSREIFDEIYRKFKGKSPFAGIYLTLFPAAVILDLDMIKNILIKDFDYFQDRPLYYNEQNDPLSAHIIALRGSKWKRLRNTLTPTFSSARTKFMFPTVVDVSRQLVHVICEELNYNKVLEMQELLARYTTDVIGNCAFGIECNSLSDPDAEFRKYGKKHIMNPLHSQFTVFLCAKCPTLARALQFKMTSKDVSAFFNRIVRETVTFREKYNVHRNDFLDLLLPLKAKDAKLKQPGELSLNEITAQAFVFFLAGFETSSTTLCYALYELACNPSIQDKARTEIAGILEKYEGGIVYEAISEMQYVDQIISETLRKYTPIPRLLRYTTKTYRHPKANLVLEKDTPVFIPIYSIHNDPDFYPNPEVFDPNRFSSDEEKKRHTMMYLPFGDGPRNCIGLRFGLMQTKIGIVNLLRNFEFKRCSSTPAPPLRFHNNMDVLKCIDGIHLEIKKI